ncbi:hypothetical protein QJS10_CPA09g00568 [Acorus calamus]|uniref:RNase H type-1 domain-containing protein n=1 Tax=Acorus calamus TaxID=4465 RepID=A0AAV9E7V1_ACOCL|nr:hypothetical protein QJS10_CPA09g00568 [Acorus calamus]
MEAEAISRGLSAAHALGATKVVVCADAQIIINAIHGPGYGPPPLQHLLAQIKMVANKIHHIQFIKVHRADVRAPEELARRARVS